MDFADVFIYETTTNLFRLDTINGLQMLWHSSHFKDKEVVLATSLWYNGHFQLQLNRQWHDKALLLRVIWMSFPLEKINQTYNFTMNFLERCSLRLKLYEHIVLSI